MQCLRDRGNTASRPFARHMACHQAHSSLPSMGRERLRPRPMSIVDIHTHRPRLLSIIDIDPAETRPAPLRPGLRYSVGIHPWSIPHATAGAWATTCLLALDRRVLAIGETGLDRVRGEASLDLQILWLRRHAALAESVGKPLILHIVRCFPEIIALRNELQPRQPWIIHGFRGKPQLASELLRHGFRLSFGRKFNPESLAMTPAPLRESDLPSRIEQA